MLKLSTFIVAVTLALTTPAFALKDYITSSDVKLPPTSQRQILGTWLNDGVLGGKCTRSIEEVKGKFYEVRRCDDGSGGDTGRILTRPSAKRFNSTTSRSGDHYIIQANGNLELRDNDGRIDIEPRSPTLMPKPIAR